MLSQQLTFTWKDEDLIESLLLVMRENGMERRFIERHRRKLEKLRRRGRLHFPNQSLEWVWRLCAAQLMLGRYHWYGWEARSEWAWRWVNMPWMYPRWDGRPCRLLVLGEQGIGDEILFASCYSELLADNPDVTLECDPRLHPVFERTWPQIKLISRWMPDAPGEPLRMDISRGDLDAWIPAGNVPKLYRQDPSHFPGTPYLKVDPRRVEHYRNILAELGPAPYVGVSWAGRSGVVDAHELMVGGATYVNMQWNDEHPNLFNVEQPTFDDTFALSAALDWINSVPASICHVAGSIGTRCNVIKADPVYGEANNRLRWQFGTGRRMHWYDSLRVWHSLDEWRCQG